MKTDENDDCNESCNTDNSDDGEDRKNAKFCCDFHNEIIEIVFLTLPINMLLLIDFYYYIN